MLREILSALAEDTIYSPASLAHKLGVSESLLQPMLNDLVQMGYLAENGNCVLSCGNCPLAKACGPTKTQRLWLLTEKGQKLVAE